MPSLADICSENIDVHIRGVDGAGFVRGGLPKGGLGAACADPTTLLFSGGTQSQARLEIFRVSCLGEMVWSQALSPADEKGPDKRQRAGVQIMLVQRAER